MVNSNIGSNSYGLNHNVTRILVSSNILTSYFTILSSSCYYNKYNVILVFKNLKESYHVKCMMLLFKCSDKVGNKITISQILYLFYVF